MSSFLNAGDWFVIVAYLLGVIGFGVWLGKGQKNTRDYFLGSKSIPWWGVGLSIVATETSALTFIGVPAMAFGEGGNLSFIQIIIGYVIARVVLAVVMVPHYFKGEIYSPYQLFSQAFGPPARRTVAIFFLIAGTLAAGVRVYVTCIPIQLMLGLAERQIFWAILLFVGLSLIYTYIGGVKAVVWTDAIQFLLFMAGGVFALFYIPSLLEGGLRAALGEAAAAGKLHWLNREFSLGRPINIWMGLIGATFHVMSSHGADQLIVQRVLTCKSVTEGRRALALSAVIILPLFLLFLLTGVMLWVYYRAFPNMPIAIPEVRPGISKNDYVFPIFIISNMPHLVKGFLIVAILSAAMSSISSALAALASVSTMDIVKGMAKRARDEAYYLRLSRYSTAGWAVVLVVVAVFTQHVDSVLNAAFSLNGLTSGALLGGLLLALFWKGRRATPVIAGMISALTVMTTIEVGQKLKALRPLWDSYVGTEIFWPWYTLIGTIVTIAVALLTSALLPSPQPPRNL